MSARLKTLALAGILVGCGGRVAADTQSLGDIGFDDGIVHARDTYISDLGTPDFLRDVRQIALGPGYTCALRTDGTVACWGYNHYGTLGDGTKESRGTPATVLGLSDVAEISAGFDSACARLTSGTVQCWGSPPDAWGVPSGPTTVPGLSAVAQIGVAGRHKCARHTDGTARCWGDNSNGQLGDGTRTHRPLPTPVTGLSDVAQIAPGHLSTCARRTDGAVLCWGLVTLGDGSPAFSTLLTPTIVPGLSDAVEIANAPSAQCTCARLTGGKVKCWGEGTCGRTSAPVPGLAGALQIGVGGAVYMTDDLYRCALLGDRNVACWGDNSFGQLGDGTRTRRSTIMAVPGLASVAEIALGDRHVCARLVDGTVECWGANHDGQLGDGTKTDRPTPTPVTR